MTDHAELLRRWQRMYNAMDSKHEDKWPKDDDFQKLRQDTHAALAARPVTPTVLVVDGATSLWIDGAKVAQWSRELSTDEVISLIENPWGMFKPASAPKFPTMLRKMWSGGEVQAWINEHWPTTPASAPEALSFNEWFLSLPEGRKKVLAEGSLWLLAEVAYDAALAAPSTPAAKEQS